MTFLEIQASFDKFDFQVIFFAL